MKQRVISAAIAIAIVIPLFLIGGVVFKTGVVILAGLAFIETLSLKESHKPYPGYIKVLAFLCLEMLVLSNLDAAYLFLTISIMILALTIPTIFDKKDNYTTKESLHLIGTVILLGIIFNLIILIFDRNKWLFLYLILIAILTDTFAMITGKLIGKHRLIPDVSPNKTVEGSIFGTLVGTIIPVIFYYYIMPSSLSILNDKIGIIVLVVMTLAISLISQLGDLFFSKMKRENGIKDFSNIMPGHGGILDRLDSLSFVMLAYILIINIIYLIW